MGEVDVVEIKKTTEKGRNREAKAAKKKRSVNHGLVGILCRDRSPMADPPRTKFPWRKNTDGHKVEEFGFRDDRHVVTCKRQLAVGIDWRNHHGGGACDLPLGSHLDFTNKQIGGEGREDSEAGMQELGRGKQRRLKVQFLWDIPGPDTVSKSAQSSPDSHFQKPSMPRGHSAVISKKLVGHLITRVLSSK
jgi:hypothetical protein